ncbi:hypothetical protein V6N12_073536 [Hibiscus sabdariffa]|uniref:Uncharacterized protein n=1 Tax=Hibiscus sabdariffa TaxID=183260 RepID=A0ABR2BHE4_9ROSI
MNQGAVATANGGSGAGSVGVQIQQSRGLPDFLQSVNLNLRVNSLCHDPTPTRLPRRLFLLPCSRPS